MDKRRNCFLDCSSEAIWPLFHNIFNISLSSGVKLHIHLLNVVVRFIVLLTSATLIFRGTDFLKCFRESLGIRDNESRLYLFFRGIDALSGRQLSKYKCSALFRKKKESQKLSSHVFSPLNPCPAEPRYTLSLQTV